MGKNVTGGLSSFSFICKRHSCAPYLAQMLVQTNFERKKKIEKNDNNTKLQKKLNYKNTNYKNTELRFTLFFHHSPLYVYKRELLPMSSPDAPLHCCHQNSQNKEIIGNYIFSNFKTSYTRKP